MCCTGNGLSYAEETTNTGERWISNAHSAMRSCKQQARDGEQGSTQCQLQVVNSENLHITVERRVIDCI